MKIEVLNKVIVITVLLTISSCIPLKDIKYVQPDEKLKLNEYGMIQENKPVYRLQKGDLINIRIAKKQALDLGLLSGYTVEAGARVSGGSLNNQNSGIVIQEDGNIELPRIGKIYVLGNTLEEARNKIEGKFYEIFRPDAAYIEVRLTGISYTLVGEAGSGNFFVPRHEFNLLEAFARSGDLSPVADRNHIQIIRTTPDGTRRVEVDITKESIMNSEFFWVQNNDVIIVNPRRQKQWGIGINPIATISTVMGAIATVVGVYFFFKRF